MRLRACCALAGTSCRIFRYRDTESSTTRRRSVLTQGVLVPGELEPRGATQVIPPHSETPFVSA
eukprot:3192705-Rhodomonas_salina.1